MEHSGETKSSLIIKSGQQMKKGNKSQGKLLVNGKLIELHKLTPDFEKFRIKNWFTKLRNFKPIFDRIRLRSYPDALRFWDEQVIPHSENNPLSPLRSNLPITFDLLSDKTYFHFTEDLIRSRLIETDLSKDEFVNDKNNLSISPVNEEEKAIFNEWFYNRYSKIWYDLESMKEKVFSILEKSPDKNKYLVNEIEKLENKKVLNKSNRSNYRDKLTMKLEDVLLRGELPNWKETHTEELIHFAKMKFDTEKLVFLKQTLKEVEDRKTNSGAKEKRLKKLVWNGNQKELAELFIVLQKKKWIDEIDMSGYDCNEIAENICHLFDLTKTKKKKGSNENKSFYQILKGEPDRDEKTKRTFPQVYSTKYKKKFDAIKSRTT